MPVATYATPFKVQEKRPQERAWCDHGIERHGQFEMVYFASQQDARHHIVNLMVQNQSKRYRVVDTRL